MKKNVLVLWMCVAIAVILFVYRGWIGVHPMSAGDWSYHPAREVANFSLFPQAWRFDYHAGLGSNGVFITSLETYFVATARIFYALTGLPWALSERIIWYLPFVLVGLFSSFIFARTVSPKGSAYWLTPIIFLTNTYILIVTGGGQMGIAMAYAVAPLVFASFIQLFETLSFRTSLIAGLMFAIMTGLDPRIAFIIAMGIFLYWICMMLIEKKVGTGRIVFFVLPFLCTILFHAFWILPLVLFRVNPIESLGAAYSSVGSVIFFSFGDFSHSLSLLHPNWPENIFGKVYFLQPEFLLIPVFAFAGFFGIHDKKKSFPLICLSLVALSGIFLSKGAKDPGGHIYLWMFERIPGFNVFRDPTKFYLLIAIVYSIMIPFTIDWITSKMPKGFFWKIIPSIIFVLFWLVTIRQAVFGQLSGTFVEHSFPKEYEVLEGVIDRPEYFRTLWVPHVQRYGLSIPMHPAIDAGTILDTSTPSAMLEWVNSKEGTEQLSRWSVKYVILPYDSQGEMFLDDRRYSMELRDEFQEALDANKNLKKVSIPGISPNMSVYETPAYKDHIWTEEAPAEKVWWQMNSPASYTVKIPKTGSESRLIFTETFDPYWQIKFGNIVIKSQKTADNLNSFVLPTDHPVTGVIEYLPQTYVGYGMWVSVISLVLLIAGILLL